MNTTHARKKTKKADDRMCVCENLRNTSSPALLLITLPCTSVADNVFVYLTVTTLTLVDTVYPRLKLNLFTCLTLWSL